MHTSKKSSNTAQVFLYARVSTERQVEKNLSIPDQLARMRAYCDTHNYQILDQYVDEGRSGTNDHRPELQAMIQRTLSGEEKIHAILVHSLSRAFRNFDDLVLYSRQLKSVGSRFLSITQDVDQETTAGRVMTVVTGLMDEMSSAENAKHVKRTLRANARNGHFNGSKPPYGYKTAETKHIGRTGYRKILVEDETESVIVREIFNLYDGSSGYAPIGMKKIVEHLNAKCLYRGQPWRIQLVQRILSDPVYTGVYMYGARRLRNQQTLDSPTDVEDSQ
ncbi:recombinase family protein [Alcaligenaceae bacterium]|nr:recombinase family protein [Alcaligenaceae bacterium]